MRSESCAEKPSAREPWLRSVDVRAPASSTGSMTQNPAPASSRQPSALRLEAGLAAPSFTAMGEVNIYESWRTVVSSIGLCWGGAADDLSRRFHIDRGEPLREPGGQRVVLAELGECMLHDCVGDGPRSFCLSEPDQSDRQCCRCGQCHRVESITGVLLEAAGECA